MPPHKSERLTLPSPRPPISEPSSPRRVGVMGMTNRRECLTQRGSMPSAFSPRESGSLPRALTPREKTMRRSIRGVPSSLPRTEQEAVDTVASARKEAAALASIRDCVPFKSLKNGGDFLRPTVLEVGPKESSIGSDLVRAPALGAGAPDAAQADAAAQEENAKQQSARLELHQMRRHLADMGAVRSKTVDGHAEAAMSVMREFFQNRPTAAMLEVLRDMDTDGSNTIDESEFKTGMRKLNMELSDRDIRAVFRSADTNGSGEIDIEEFFNCFRTDSFPRDTFFWSKTRPRGLLNREERVGL